MTPLPITHMTLYKHGVGYVERRAQFSGEEVTLTFRVEEMNDILKSLTAIDWGDGQVLGIDYATPQGRDEQLAGNSIRLGDDRSLRDLLVCLRGRRVQLLLDQGETWVGTLIGLDEPFEEQPLTSSLMTMLLDNTQRVQSVPLGRVQGVQVEDERAATDLRFFLEASLTQETHRQVRIYLSADEHDLTVSYVAPAPTWRVSYRLVAEQTEDGPLALLLGWGIFDNRMEEDLQGISLSLVAGMPISFIYDLYNPFTPDRPVIQEEARVAAGPVAFGAAMEMDEAAERGARPEAAMAMMAAPSAPAPQGFARASRKMSRADVQQSTQAAATGESLGELFQYNIATPVSVGRGRSAMVPIVSTDLPYRKDLLYNSSQMATHPVATLRFKNSTGLTLERGPVTVIENGDYVGEAILPFTAESGEFIIPYAVELGIKVSEQQGVERRIEGLHVRGNILVIEEWDIRWRTYQINSSTNEPKKVLVEHPRQGRYDLFDTPKPAEQTDAHWRFEVEVPPRSETTLRVQTRALVSRREQLERQSLQQLQEYLRRGLINRDVYEQVSKLLRLWEQIADNERRLQEVDQQRQKIYQAQQQIQGNMGALGTSGREGTLRTRYVDQLEAQEEQLQALSREENEKRAEIERLKAEIEKQVAALS